MTSLRDVRDRPGAEQAVEPTLRDILRSQGIEPEGDVRNRKRREAKQRRRALQGDLQAQSALEPRKQVALPVSCKS